MKADSVKILTAYHKKAFLTDREPFYPIHAGRAISDDEWCKEVLPGDDTGDNISDKNASYNELSAVYWAWKNYDVIGNPDAVGLCHYRRFFIFEKRDGAYYETDKTDGGIYEKIKCDGGNISALLGDCDFVAPKPNVRKSVYANYNLAHRIEELDAVLRIINEQYPTFAEAADKYVRGKDAFYYNMFIFSKAVFFEYCEFIFGVLSEFEKSGAAVSERMFVSECLTGIFFTYLMDKGAKPLFLPVMYAAEKVKFKDALDSARRNVKSKQMSLLYALKPLIVFFIPKKLLLRRRQRTNLTEK